MCDKMPDEDSAHDPTEDAEIEEEGTFVEYLINTTLHEMITAARQTPDIMLVMSKCCRCRCRQTGH
jgi:hypothetical protein